jgi:hypothetical protein
MNLTDEKLIQNISRKNLSEEKRRYHFGRSVRRYEGSIKFDLKNRARGCERDLILTQVSPSLSQGKVECRVLLNAALKIWLPRKVGNILTRLEPFSFSRMILLGINF